MKGKIAAIIITICVAIIIAAAVVTTQLKSVGTLFTLLQIVQAVCVLVVLWALWMYMKRKFKMSQMRALSGTLQYMSVPQMLWHVLVVHNKKEDTDSNVAGYSVTESSRRKEIAMKGKIKGKLNLIVVAVCFGVTIAAVVIALQAEYASPLFNAMGFVQAISFLVGLWALVSYLSKVFKARRTIHAVSDMLYVATTPKYLWQALLTFRTKTDKVDEPK